MVSRDEYDEATERADRRRKADLFAVAAHYDPDAGSVFALAEGGARGLVVVRLDNGLYVGFDPHDAQGLENASPEDLNTIEISPSGFGLHFPKLDADLYLPALLEGLLGSKRWMAARLGQTGGKSRSVAKAAASRSNGKRGGRPRRQRASA